MARNGARTAPLVAISLALGLAATGCAGWGGGGGGADSLNVLMVNNPQMIDLQKLTAANFTKQTGIKVNFTVLPENDVRPRGWDVVVDCTGVVAAIEDGLSRVAPGGTFQQFGVSAGKAEARFSPYRVYNKEITIVGSMAVLHSFERAGDLFVGGALKPDVMISDRFPLAEYPKAIDQFKNGIGRKIQVNPV